jgi:hypothetical protein
MAAARRLVCEGQGALCELFEALLEASVTALKTLRWRLGSISIFEVAAHGTTIASNA